MLPGNLLRTRVSHGTVQPIFARPDEENLDLAFYLTTAYQTNLGGRKIVLDKVLRKMEEARYDYRLIRGMSALLERRSVFETVSSVDPSYARKVVFEEASSRRAVTKEDREEIIRDVAVHLKLTPQELEDTLWADLDEELVLRDYKPVEPKDLVRYYNLALTQTLLFKSLRLEFTATKNWQRIFRAIKHLGLMFTVEKTSDPAGFKVVVDGPLSLFKMTDRYGTALAKLLPEIVKGGEWTLHADILGRDRDRVYELELSSHAMDGLMSDLPYSDGPGGQSLFDSRVEEHFATNFEACKTGWTLTREPEPLSTGQQVMIPDFSFQKYGVKVYLEIVGHWTQDYLERKLRKLSMISDGVDMIVAVNKDLSCSRLQESLHGKRLFYYSKNVPVRPVLEYLKQKEEEAISGQVDDLIAKGIHLQGDIVSIDELANYYNVSPDSVNRILKTHIPIGYRRLGDYYVSMQLSEELMDEIGRLGDASLTTALGAIEKHGFKHPERVLEDLGYSVVWNGLDYQNTKVYSKDDWQIDN